MAFGFGVLRLSARDFWQLTPRELASAMRAVYGETAAPLSRAALEELMTRFPDRVRSAAEAARLEP